MFGVLGKHRRERAWDNVTKLELQLFADVGEAEKLKLRNSKQDMQADWHRCKSMGTARPLIPSLAAEYHL